jgi:hypothetical protein
MAHLAWLILLGIVLGIGFVHRIWYSLYRGGRAVNRERRAQAQSDLEARVATQLEESEHRYGVTGHVRPATAEEIAEVRKQIGWKD